MKKTNRFSISNFKLRTQLLLSFGVILVISIGTLSGFAITKTRSQLIDQNADQLQDVRDTAFSVATGALENELKMVQSWVDNPAIRATATFASTLDPVLDLWERYEGTKWGDDADPLSTNVTEKTEVTIDYTNDVSPESSIWMNNLLVDFSYSEIFFTDARGYAISSTGNTGDFAQSDEEWWQEAKSDNLFISDFEFDESSSTWSIAISHIIESTNITMTNGPVAGVLKAQYNFGSMVIQLEEALHLDEYLLVIYGGVDNQIVYRSDEDSNSAPLVDAFLDGKPNSRLESDESFDGTSNLLSESYYVSKASFQLGDDWPLQWNFLAGIPESVVSDLIYEQIISTVLLGFVALVVLIVVSFYVSKFLVKKLVEIQENANEVANGNLTTKVNVDQNAQNEISVLATNFNNMTDRLKSLVLDISEMSSSTSNIAEELASSSEEVSASVEEVSSTTHSMAKGASQQAELIAKMVESVNEAGHMVETIIERIQENTTLVGEIAQETKYLALNARIEAARAGASGRGFSVVAEDVKNLSEQSRETAEAVGEIVESISTTLESFFNEMKERIDTIAAVSEETAASAEEVAAATEEMSASMEQITASSQQMTIQSMDAESKIKAFKIN